MRKDDIIKLLNETIIEYKNNEDLIYYRLHLAINGLTAAAFYNWIKKDILEITELYNILEDMQESRIVNGMILKNSNINTTGAIFYLKCKKQWIEEEKLQAKEIITDNTISIEFEDVE